MSVLFCSFLARGAEFVSWTPISLYVVAFGHVCHAYRVKG